MTSKTLIIDVNFPLGLLPNDETPIWGTTAETTMP